MGCCASDRSSPEEKGSQSPSAFAKAIRAENSRKGELSLDGRYELNSQEDVPEAYLVDGQGESSRRTHSKTKSLRRRGAVRPIGLENIGNTCYMNAALQCLARTPGFLQRLEKDTSDPLICSLATLLREYHCKRNLFAELREFHRVFTLKLPKYSGYSQEDSKDFLMELMAYIEKANRPAAELFYGRRMDKITCLKCGNQIAVDAELFLVPMERQQSEDVTNYLLRAQNDEFKLTGENKLKCLFCESSSDASVVTKIVGGAQVLVVYIEPFDMHGKRLSQSVSFSERVTLLDRFYELFAVLCRHGNTIHSGHFTAKVKYQDWFLCDDARVAKLSTISNTEAYFLFYECLSADLASTKCLCTH